MSEASIRPGWAWNTWRSELPAQATYLPLGLTVTPCAYASSTNVFTRFAAGQTEIRLGPRSLNAESIALELAHAGTALSWHYDSPDPFTLCGGWRMQQAGEWGLRFWVVLCLEMTPPGRPPAEWRFDPATGAMTAASGADAVAVVGERPPLLATFHDDLDALQREFETKGYFCLDSRGERGRFAVLRYHLEEMPTFRFAAAVANAAELAVERCRGAVGLDGAAPSVPRVPAPMQRGFSAGALDAVRDVVGWNTVWDPANRRPYTSLSRSWVAQKFGGWGVWLNDVLYHALMAGSFDVGLARENLAAVLAGATAEGNLPCLMTGRDSWIDRSQPPIGAFIVWLLYLRTGARDLLELAYGPLLANHDWWWRRRDGNGDGLVEYGTSPVGSGLYRGTKLAAKDESSMDNSPVHDEAKLDTTTWTLDCADVGLNSLLALDGEMLAHIARTLGEAEPAARLDAAAAALRARIGANLWDAERRVFANRLWSGAFVRSIAPTSFYPLLAGAATADQAAAMVRLLDDREAFGGTWLLPSVRRDDPAFGDNVYWRGRIWPPLNFLTWHGLRRAGLDAAADRLAENGYFLFMGEWEPHRRCAENFNAVTGAAADQPDTDLFYGWGALLPLIAASAVMDATPWGGWEVDNAGRDVALGPVTAPGGAATVVVDDGVLTLSLAGRAVLRTNRRGRIRHLSVTAPAVTLTLPPGDGAWLELPQVPPAQIALARLGGESLQPATASGGGCRFTLPASEAAIRFELFVAAAEGTP